MVSKVGCVIGSSTCLTQADPNLGEAKLSNMLKEMDAQPPKKIQIIQTILPFKNIESSNNLYNLIYMYTCFSLLRKKL